MIFSLALIPIVGLAGAAVDYSRASGQRTELQAVTDAAAIQAAAIAGADTAERVRTARAVTAKAAPSDVQVQVQGTTVTVSVTDKVKTGMMSIVGIPQITVAARSSASVAMNGAPACVLALNPTADGAITFTGSSEFVGRGCALQSNSRSPTALSVQGSARVTADGVCSVGGASVTDRVTPRPRTGCAPVADPLASLPRPSSCACSCDFRDVKVGPNDNVVLRKGIYCGGLDIKGTARLEEGTFIVRDGPLSINSQAEVSGRNVTFYLTGAGAGFDINGGAAVDLQAPTSGIYKGVLIFQDPQSNPGGENRINGNAENNLSGIIYTPRHALRVNGTALFGQTAPQFSIIADTVTFAGNAGAQTSVSGPDLTELLPRIQSGARLTQ